MSKRQHHTENIPSTLVTKGDDFKHRYEPLSAYSDRGDRKPEHGGPSDVTKPTTQDLPSVTMLRANDPIADPQTDNFIVHPPLKILNMTNKLPRPLATNLIIPPSQANHTGTAKPAPQTLEVPHHTAEKVLIALLVTGGVVLLITWAAIRLGSWLPRSGWRLSTPSLPIVRGGRRAYGNSGLKNLPVFSSTVPQRNYNGASWTWTKFQPGIPKVTPPVMIGRRASERIEDNEPPAGQEINERAEADPYPFTGIENRTLSGASPIQPPRSVVSRTVSRLSKASMAPQPNSPSCSQHDSVVGLAIDSPTGVGQRQKVASWSKIRTLTRAVKDAAMLRRSTTTSASADLQLRGVIGQALIKATYYTPSPYPPRRSQYEEDHQHQRSLEQPNTQFGQEKGTLTSAPDLCSLVSSLPRSTLHTDDAMGVIGGTKSCVSKCSENTPVPREVSCHDVTTNVNTTPLGSPMTLLLSESVASSVGMHCRASEGQLSEEARDVLGGTLSPGTSLEKEVENPPSQERPLPPTPLIGTQEDDQRELYDEGMDYTVSSDG
ncbi:hypothetical protein V8B97DRAFT_1939644 [Scleroderma yunnanense]